MSIKKTVFANDEYYHVYNRGVDKRKIFLDKKDHERFILYLDFMNDEKDGLFILWRNYSRNHDGTRPAEFLRSHLSQRKPLVEIVAYCLNPNHYHLILKQVEKNGITEFMRKIGTGYTMYFNKKNKRSGVLFQGKFKSVYINSDDYLLYLSAYVNCNSEVHGIDQAEKYQWSSFKDYQSPSKSLASGKAIVLNQFKSSAEYARFAKCRAEAMKEKREDEKMLLESF
jgi:putative transposase